MNTELRAAKILSKVRSIVPVGCTLHQVEPWLTFKSWASWLVLKKKCQVIIDRSICWGKTNTWNLYYPQGRGATEERHLQNNSFLLLVYWSDQESPSALPVPAPPFFFHVPGPVMSGSLPNHIRAWSKLLEQGGESRRASFLTEWGLNYRQHLCIVGTESRLTGPTKGFGGGVGGGQAAEPVVIWKTEKNTRQILPLCATAKPDGWPDEI